MPADDLTTRARRWYCELLEPTFPADELVTEPDFVAAVTSGEVLVHLIGDEAAPDGIAIAEYFPKSRVLLLSWLAVRPQGRGGGIGRRLLTQALQRWRDELDPVLVLGEVEHPDSIPADPIHGDPAARLRFYDSFGARALDLPYLQPPLRPGGAAPENLMLVAFLVDGLVPGHGVPAAPLHDFLDAYLPHHGTPYEKVFRALESEGESVSVIPLSATADQLPNSPRG